MFCLRLNYFGVLLEKGRFLKNSSYGVSRVEFSASQCLKVFSMGAEKCYSDGGA